MSIDKVAGTAKFSYNMCRKINEDPNFHIQGWQKANFTNGFTSTPQANRPKFIWSSVGQTDCNAALIKAHGDNIEQFTHDMDKYVTKCRQDRYEFYGLQNDFSDYIENTDNRMKEHEDITQLNYNEQGANIHALYLAVENLEAHLCKFYQSFKPELRPDFQSHK